MSAGVSVSSERISVFAGSPLDPADHRRDQPDWLAAQWREGHARIVIFSGLKPLMMRGETLSPFWLSPSDLPEGSAADAVFLGEEDGAGHFAVSLEIASIDPERFVKGGQAEFMELRSATLQLIAAGVSGVPAILGKARSLLDWHERHGFCAVCGAQTRLQRAGAQRQCVQAACNAHHFPRVNPVVIMMVVRGDRCLLGRNQKFTDNFYSALAGFVDVGETVEEAVRREVMEEAGVVVGKVDYIRSQPWPFSSNLMLGCMAEALSDDIILDEKELADARWFSRDEITALLAAGPDAPLRLPAPVAIARDLLDDWLAQS